MEVSALDSQRGDCSVRDVLKACGDTNVGRLVNGAIAGLNRDLRLGASALLSEAKPMDTHFFASVFQAVRSAMANVSSTEYIRYLRPRYEKELRQKITAGIQDLAGRIAGARFC